MGSIGLRLSPREVTAPQQRLGHSNTLQDTKFKANANRALRNLRRWYKWLFSFMAASYKREQFHVVPYVISQNSFSKHHQHNLKTSCLHLAACMPRQPCQCQTTESCITTCLKPAGAPRTSIGNYRNVTFVTSFVLSSSSRRFETFAATVHSCPTAQCTVDTEQDGAARHVIRVCARAPRASSGSFGYAYASPRQIIFLFIQS